MEWLIWRHRGIGASDSPAIMGVSPWKTRMQLWEEKIQPTPKMSAGNWATRRGHELEPRARARYELETGREMPPLLAIHLEHSFLRASMDGFNKELNRGLEIKCPGKADHSLAKEGKIPKKYQYQIWHQFLVTGASAIDYYSFDGTSGVCLEVLPDHESIGHLFREELKFWSHVVTKTPPNIQEEDFVAIEDQKQISRILEFKIIQSELTRLSERSDELKKIIIKNMKHKRMTGSGVKIFPTLRKGSVEYSNIPELKAVDLELYRKPSTEFYSFKLIKEGEDGEVD